MSLLKFSDGEEFDTSGDLRVEERFDGFYVIGSGSLTPVKSEVQGETLITKLKNKNNLFSVAGKEDCGDI